MKVPTRMRLLVLREDRGEFSRLRDARVLIYWPHGLGDFVHLGSILPMLEASNEYLITRIGDDYLAMLDGARGVTPIHTGIRGIDDGTAYGARHLGIDFRRIDGRMRDVLLIDPLAQALRDTSIDVVLYTDYPEPEGRSAFPFHTKARHLAKYLVSKERREQIAWDAPLPSALSFAAPQAVQDALDARLESAFGVGARVLMIATGGHTEPRKHWPVDREQALLLRWLAGDPRNVALRMQTQPLERVDTPRIATFAHLFGDLELPFALLLKALLARIALVVGVPAGPLHAAMAYGGIPLVGIWQAHHPEWYDEPNPRSRHLVGSYVRARGFERRAATRSKPAQLRQTYRYVADNIISVEDVWHEVEVVEEP